MKIYITKYALTKGIKECDADEISDSMACVKSEYSVYDYFHGNDWHKTEAEAIARAEQMRNAKIKSLRKQIAKLEAMTFGDAE